MNVISVILAGGNGTRLWPLSRKSMPKQFLSLFNEDSFLKNTCNRIEQISDADHQIIVTNLEHENLVRQQLGNDIKIITEKVGRNTAPAILAAALKVQNDYGNNSVIIVLPSDHIINITDKFVENIQLALNNITEKKAITFGMSPKYPETGYGYIEVCEEIKKVNDRCYEIKSFKEKPNLLLAKEYVESGMYLWNSGIFVFDVDFLIEQYKNICEEIYNQFTNIDMNDSEEIYKAYENCKSISIDYAIMENLKKAYVIPSDFGWSDVGTWRSIYDISNKDENNNVIKGKCINQDTKDSIIIGNESRLIATLGIHDLCIIDTSDAILISDMKESNKLSVLLDSIKIKNNKFLIENQTTYRPWGSYSILLENQGYKIKKIVVQANQKLSLQYHYHRSEHWTIVKGTAKVVIGKEEKYVYENQSIYIPKTVSHRLINEGHMPLEVIEVQCGEYLEEDDIVRIDDIYNR